MSGSSRDDFLDEDVEATIFSPPNYYYIEEDFNVDDLANSNTRVEKFKNTLLIAHGKDEKESFFYSICYAVCGQKHH